MWKMNNGYMHLCFGKFFDARSIFQKGLSARPSVRLSATLPLQFCKMQKNKAHIVSAREISTFLCVEMTMCQKILDIVSAREIHT